MGVVLDHDRNYGGFKKDEVNLISSDSSKVKVYVITTNEELMIAKDTERLVKKHK